MSEQASVLVPKQEPSDGGAVKPSGTGILPGKYRPSLRRYGVPSACEFFAGQ